MDYTGLKNEIALPQYNMMTDEQIAAALTADTITVPVDVASDAAFSILAASPTGDWGRVSSRGSLTLTGQTFPDAPIIAARTAVALLSSGQPIHTSDATVLSVLQSSLNALVAAGDINTDSAAAIQALTTATTNRAAQLGFGAGMDMVSEMAAARKYG